MAADFAGHEDALARTLEVAERCSVEIDLGTILLPKYPVPEGRDAFDYLVELCEKGLVKRYGNATPELPRAPALRVEDGSRDGLRRLLSHRLGLHPLREAERDQRRPRPWVLGGIARCLLPEGHGRRSDPLRPPLRALSESRPERPARHGHRLLRRRPRPGHQLRRRQVRARPRRGSITFSTMAARAASRRRSCARHPVRRRRPDQRSSCRRGPARRSPTRFGPGPSCGRRWTRTPSRRRSSTSPSRSRVSRERTRSTRPAS